MRARIGTLLGLGLCLTIATSVAAQRIRLPVGKGQLEEAVRKDSLDASAHYNVALAYWNEKQFDRAEQEFNAALALDPRFAPAHLALAYLPFGRRPRLWDDIDKRNWPDSIVQVVGSWQHHQRVAYLIDPLVNLAIIGAATPGKDARWDMFESTRDYYDTFFQGYDDISQGKYQEAFFSFNRMLDMYSEAFSRDRAKWPEEWIWWRGQAASRIPDRYQVAIDDFQEILNRTVGRERSDTVYAVPLITNEVRYLIGTVYQRAGKLDEAVRTFREVLENDIGLYMANVRLADIYESQRRYPEAIRERQQAVTANPDDASLLLDLGVTLGKAGQFEDAVEALNQSAAANPRDPRTVFWLGLAHFQLNHRDEAKTDFTRFVAIAPSRMNGMVTLAQQRLSELQ
jgi:tetratricopeptide (TPR) repeat protein